MSFVFPNPANTNNPSNSSSYPDFDYDDNHYKLIWNPEPDYDELLIRLSLFAFTRLSPSDQQEKVEEISHTVNVQNVQFSDELSDEASRLATFAELLKKLPFSDQLEVFLSKVIEKFQRERQGMTSSDDEARSNIWTSSSFGEFFLGFSVIWFQGQSTRGQDMLIEQLDKGTKGVVIDKRRQEESEEDFKLRRFRELCMSVVDFQVVQEEFLETAEWKLQNWGFDCDTRLIGEPQALDSAAELLSRLWTFGVSLLSAKYQEQKIVEMSTQVESGVENEIPLAAAEDHHDEEAVRMKRLTDLFNQVPVPTRIDLFKELRETLLVQKRYSEAVRVFKELGSKSQREIVEYMLHELTTWSSDKVEKFSGESEEDFRFRRFNQICITHLSTCGEIYWPEAYSLQMHTASDPYDELLFGVAIFWFKATCANIRRNPVQLILFGKVEIGDTNEKLLDESEEDYRLRRSEESFKQLEFASQENVLDYIQDTISADLGYPKPKITPYSLDLPSEGAGLFDPDWINYRPTNPRNQVAATTQAAISGQGPHGS